MTRNKGFQWTDDEVESILRATLSYISINRVNVDCESCQSSSARCVNVEVPLVNKQTNMVLQAA